MRLVVDSNIFVSALDPKDAFHKECYPVLERILSLDIEALCPALVLVEVACVLRRRTGMDALAHQAYQRLSLLPSINWLDMSLESAERACVIGIRTGLKAGDAVVLQVAEQHGVPLLTRDKELKGRALKGILVFEPLEVPLA